MKKTAVVTGANGQDGSHLCELLLEKGYRVFATIRNGSDVRRSTLGQAARNESLTVLPGDVYDWRFAEGLIASARPDEVYNLAAVSSVADSWKAPSAAMAVNTVGAARIFQAVMQHTPKARVFQASSSEMFGEATEPRQDEFTMLDPTNPYGASKAAAHQLAGVLRRGKEMFIACGILYNHEGPRRGDQFVTRKITRTAVAIAAGRATELRLGNLDAPRDWGYAPEYVEAMWRTLQHGEPDDFVIGTGVTHTVREFVAAAFRAVGIADWERFVVVDPAFFRPLDAYTLCADPTRAEQELGWKATTQFDELVRKMVEADAELIGFQLPG